MCGTADGPPPRIRQPGASRPASRPAGLRAGGGVALRAVPARRLGPARVDDLVDAVDQAVVRLDVGGVARARRRRLDAAEGVVEEVLAEHAPVGDRRALDGGEVGRAERVLVHDALDDVVLAHRLGERAGDRGELLARHVAWREHRDVGLGQVDAVLLARRQEGGEGVVLLEVGLLLGRVLQGTNLLPVQVRALHRGQRVGDVGHHGCRHPRAVAGTRADNKRGGASESEGEHW
mmetsp:Transcript_9119/g.30190  ORF Transcript_9119/g.30190 Transcript_9119/m.30190 type:complete len:234 (+) Transcript_9119:134-835(+)